MEAVDLQGLRGGPHYFAEAERILATHIGLDPIAQAQVYATLALVAATLQTKLSEAERQDLGWGAVLPTSIEELYLSVRAYNVLRRAGITTVDQLCELTVDDLYNMRNMGHKSVDDIIARLQEQGRQLRSSF